MTKLFARWLPCATLATWSAILLYFYFSGRVVAFLAPTFRPYVLVAGVVLALMSAVFLFARADASCCSAADCGHSLAKMPIGKLMTFLVLLLPVVLTAVVSPDSFGKNVMLNRGIDTDGSTLRPRKSGPPAPVDLPLPTKDPAPAQPAPAIATTTAPAAPAPAAPTNDAAANSQQPPANSPTDYLTRTPDGNIVAEVLDLLYAAQDAALRKDFEGKKVELIGQLMPDAAKNANGPKRFKAVRMFMTCCAADARPVATLVEVPMLPDLPEMTWVKITGTSTFPLENGRRTAILKADKVEKTAPPAETMLN